MRSSQQKRLLILFIQIALLFCLAGEHRHNPSGAAHASQDPVSPVSTAVTNTQDESQRERTESSGPESPMPSAPPVFPASIDKGCDLVLLIDNSASLKRSDPFNYGKDAAKLFISLFGADDRVSVMSFGDAGHASIGLTHDTDQNRPALFNAVERITAGEIAPHIVNALQKGFDELHASPRSERILVMFSDNGLAPHSGDNETQAALKALVHRLAAGRIKVYAVALSEGPAGPLLEFLAHETGGFVSFVRTAADIHLGYSSVFEKIKTPDVAVVAGDSFTIDGRTREATVLISRKAAEAVSLVGPGGIQYSARKRSRQIAWYASSVYDLITIRNPAPGLWLVKSSRHDDSRVYLLTDFSLKSSSIKSSVPRGETVAIQVWLEQESGVVADPEALNGVTWNAVVNEPGGASYPLQLDAVLNTGSTGKTGVFTAALDAHGEGEYRVNVTAKGTAFTRVKEIAFSAVGPAGHPGKGKSPFEGAADDDEISWWYVFARFILVNFVVALLIGASFVLRAFKMKFQAKRAKT